MKVVLRGEKEIRVSLRVYITNNGQLGRIFEFALAIGQWVEAPAGND